MTDQAPAPAGLPPGTKAIITPTPTAPTTPVVEPTAPAAEPAAPVAEPTAPATQEPFLQTPAEAPAPVPVFNTGNDVFNSVGTVLAKAGVKDASAALAELAKTGVLSIETKAALLTEGDPAIVGLALAQADGELGRLKETAVAEKSVLQEYAKGVFGGDDAAATWDQMGAYFTNSQDFTDAERATLNGLLSNAETGRIAINEIAAKHRKSAGYSQPADLIQGDQPTGGNFVPLGKADYVSEMRTAVQKHGEGSREVQALQTRRTASIKRGY